MAVMAYESEKEAKESAKREFNSCIEAIRQGIMSYIKTGRIIRREDVARHYIKKYGFSIEPLESALKEGYEKLWQGFTRRLECKAFLEGKPRIYVFQGNQLVPFAEVSSLANLETKAGFTAKEKKQFSSAHFQKTKTEKMHRNIFHRKII